MTESSPKPTSASDPAATPEIRAATPMTIDHTTENHETRTAARTSAIRSSSSSSGAGTGLLEFVD